MTFFDWAKRHFRPDEHCQDPDLEANRAQREYAAFLKAEAAAVAALERERIDPDLAAAEEIPLPPLVTAASLLRQPATAAPRRNLGRELGMGKPAVDVRPRPDFVDHTAAWRAKNPGKVKAAAAARARRYRANKKNQSK